MNLSVPILPVPQVADARAKISELMNRLPFGDLSDARRAEIERNALVPVTLMIDSVQLAAAAGPDVEAVFVQFVRQVYAQAEIAKREQHLARLLERLQALRPGAAPALDRQGPQCDQP